MYTFFLHVLEWLSNDAPFSVNRIVKEIYIVDEDSFHGLVNGRWGHNATIVCFFKLAEMHRRPRWWLAERVGPRHVSNPILSDRWDRVRYVAGSNSFGQSPSTITSGHQPITIEAFGPFRPALKKTDYNCLIFSLGSLVRGYVGSKNAPNICKIVRTVTVHTQTVNC